MKQMIFGFLRNNTPHFSLDFEFNNPVTQKAFGKIFNDLAQNMVMAFSERAKEVYRG